MTTALASRTTIATQWKMRRFEWFLNHHTDYLTERFGPSESAERDARADSGRWRWRRG